MVCPNCGTDNKTKHKFCIKCGNNLANPGEVNIEQVDMGGYRAEEDYAEKNSFKIGSGTFTISDKAPSESTGMFTAAELNESDEEFDFSSFDEPFIPKLDADRIAVPKGNARQQGGMQTPPQHNGGYPKQPNMPQGQQMNMMNQQMGMNGMMNPQQGMSPQNPQMPQGQPMQGMGMNPYMNQMYGGQPMYGGQQMMSQPQIIGYDPNGMPIYGQPMMYPQPQIIGYDPNGMPIYGQPMMYPQPQIIGYDQNGMPIYGQPAMYAPPQPVMGENGEPVYPNMQQGMGMPQQMMNGMPMNGVPMQPMGQPMMQPQQMPQGQPMPGMYGTPAMQPMGQPQQPVQPQPEPVPAKEKKSEKVNMTNEFWNNFLGDSDDSDDDEGQDDFFAKPRYDRSRDMGSVSTDNMDFGQLKKQDKKKKQYMNDTPDVNADDLKPNTRGDLNKRYMRATDVVNADDLAENKRIKTQDKMNVTSDVNADELETYERKKSNVTMNHAGEANADELEAYERVHTEAIMAHADHAVEALPKKKTLEDEIDKIELPEYMQAKKTVNNSNTPEIPGLPEI